MSTQYDRTHAKKVVIHHFGDGMPAAKTKEEAFKRANPYHYEFPEYDFIILDDGTILTARPLNYIGAHCVADKAKYQYSKNWWNENSIGIAMANDNTKYPPSQAMVNSLTTLLTDLCHKQGMTIDDLYPHFQVSATACPGGSYAKLGLDTGFFDYDLVERSVYRNLNPVSQPAPQPAPQPEPTPVPKPQPAPVSTPTPVVQPPANTPAPVVEPPKVDDPQPTVFDHLKDVRLWVAVLGLVKLILNIFGVNLILDSKVNDYANAAAMIFTVIGVFSTYKDPKSLLGLVSLLVPGKTPASK